MKTQSSLCLAVVIFGAVVSFAQNAKPQQASAVRTPNAQSLPKGVTSRSVTFFSEGIQCYGGLFLPSDFSPEGKLPGVVVAPGWGETAASVESYAALLASRGIVAMVLDYRSWGRSGGYLSTVDQVRTDDRLRFSQLTAKIRIERKRLWPQQQVIDIRNALYYLQGEPGVDRTRVGVWGTDMAGGHAVVIAALDARIKAVVAQVPVIDGKETPKRASTPNAVLLRADQKRARYGETSNGAVRSDALAEIALSEYHPFWSVDQVPAKTAVLFVIAEGDPKSVNETANAASKALKGPTNVVTIPGATKATISRGASREASATAAAEWFLKYL